MISWYPNRSTLSSSWNSSINHKYNTTHTLRKSCLFIFCFRACVFMYVYVNPHMILVSIFFKSQYHTYIIIKCIMYRNQKKNENTTHLSTIPHCLVTLTDTQRFILQHIFFTILTYKEILSYTNKPMTTRTTSTGTKDRGVLSLVEAYNYFCLISCRKSRL